ncbi:YqeG family HAD IIIA-type phosphatase [Paenibacillus aurantius]|uniref:YqeG family HAD IIIA-type phosphatase n=1 Tax=Paenibacillus aurantius TaxID=2918900 RepID=A0AA96RHC6_9BACL|nr:YqeG family HAD IIIA-type phosphatase [Paenibacillus aurantius]WNQ13406.1 YqeG family HAD IIIA-type phosphatase [Paenibacillus aurantius]
MLNNLIPSQQVNSIYDILLPELWKNGVKGIITDLDNTLVGAKVPLATPELIEWLKHVQQLGFKVVIVSNNRHARVSKFADPLGIPFIFSAKKPSNAAFRRALTMMNLPAEAVAVIGDQMLTDVLGGNRMGLHTILVQPISLLDEGFFTKVNRRLEKIALTFMKKP